jgi:polar amino acid transport system permease protein
LRPLPAFLLVVLPQAMRAIVPPLVSNYTYMIKATSLLSVIAFAELLRTAQLMAQSMARPLEVYSAVALVYLAIVTVVTLGQGALERRLSRATARPAPAPAAVLDTPAPAAPPAVAPPAAPALLEARGITKRHGGFVALQPTTLSIAQGEVVAVMGASGSGKSTLVRCLNWLDPPEEGVVLLAGKPVGAAPLQGGGRRALPGAEVAAMRARFGMVFQRFHLFGHLTAAENVALGPRKVLGLPRARAMEEARAQLARLGLAAEADRYPATLSGGQRQRVAIARALAMRPEVLLFDEPTSALDPESVQEVLSAIRMLAASGATMVVVTHEVGFARAAAHRVLFLAGGRVVEDAAAARFFAAPADPHARVFLAGHMQGTTP